MNKFAILMLAALLSASLLAPSLPRHQNPEQLSDELPSGIELLSLYGLVVNAASGGNFTSAYENLRRLADVYVPESARYVYSRFNGLLDRELRELNETKRSLDYAEQELSKGFPENARDWLRKAGISLAEAELIHSDLKASCEEFSRAIGVSLTQLSEKIEKLSGLIELYRGRLKDLLSELRRIEEARLLDTFLMLRVNASEVEVGSWLLISGSLYAEDGSPLSGKTISIHFNNEEVGRLSTDDAGFFKGAVKIPYVYEPEAVIFAEYAPSRADLGRFRGARSNVVVLKLRYEVPVIIARPATAKLKPLDRLEISGQVANISKGVLREIHAQFFGKTASTKISENGSFRFALTVPENASTGFHEILLYTDPLGVIAPARKALRIQIYKISTLTSIEAPKLLLCGLAAEVKGKVLIEGLGEAASGVVVVEAFGEVSSSEIENGEFSANLTVPWSILSGFAEVKATYIPSSPIYEESTAQEKILVINPLTALIPLSAMLYLAGAGVKELSRKKRRASEVEEAEVEVVEAPRPRAGEPAEIVKIYSDAVRAVEELTGVRMRASDTIREFLEKVFMNLGEIAPAFAELSYMTEAAVYGEIEPDLDLARYLRDWIRGRLHEG